MNIYFSFECLVLSDQRSKTQKNLSYTNYETGESCKSSYLKSWNWRIFDYLTLNCSCRTFCWSTELSQRPHRGPEGKRANRFKKKKKAADESGSDPLDPNSRRAAPARLSELVCGLVFDRLSCKKATGSIPATAARPASVSSCDYWLRSSSD